VGEKARVRREEKRSIATGRERDDYFDERAARRFKSLLLQRGSPLKISHF
jgi:hypothetical protein